MTWQPQGMQPQLSLQQYLVADYGLGVSVEVPSTFTKHKLTGEVIVVVELVVG